MTPNGFLMRRNVILGKEVPVKIQCASIRVNEIQAFGHRDVIGRYPWRIAKARNALTGFDILSCAMRRSPPEKNFRLYGFLLH